MASDINMSMAGLSDVSMTEINKGPSNANESINDYSMASLGGGESTSMASINDTPKVRDYRQ